MADDFSVPRHRAQPSHTQKLARPEPAATTSMARLIASASASALLTCLLTLSGCDRKPTKSPLPPEPPRPKMSVDGYRQSLLGNAILSNALLSYKVKCNDRRASIRICRIPTQVRTNREVVDT